MHPYGAQDRTTGVVIAQKSPSGTRSRTRAAHACATPHPRFPSVTLNDHSRREDAHPRLFLRNSPPHRPAQCTHTVHRTGTDGPNADPLGSGAANEVLRIRVA